MYTILCTVPIFAFLILGCFFLHSKWQMKLLREKYKQACRLLEEAKRKPMPNLSSQSKMNQESIRETWKAIDRFKIQREQLENMLGNILKPFQISKPRPMLEFIIILALIASIYLQWEIRLLQTDISTRKKILEAKEKEISYWEESLTRFHASLEQSDNGKASGLLLRNVEEAEQLEKEVQDLINIIENLKEI